MNRRDLLRTFVSPSEVNGRPFVKENIEVRGQDRPHTNHNYESFALNSTYWASRWGKSIWLFIFPLFINTLNSRYKVFVHYFSGLSTILRLPPPRRRPPGIRRTDPSRARPSSEAHSLLALLAFLALGVRRVEGPGPPRWPLTTTDNKEVLWGRPAPTCR